MNSSAPIITNPLPPRKSQTLEGFLNFKRVAKTLKRSVLLAARHEKWRLIALVIFSALTAAIPYLQNGLFGQLVDTTLSYKDAELGMSTVVRVLTLLIIATVIPSIINLVETFVETTFRFNLIREIDLFFMRKMSSLDIATIESSSYQELVQKASERGATVIYNFLTSSIRNFSNLIGVIVSLFILGFLDPILLLYAFLGVLPALYVQLRYGKDVYWIWDLNAENRRKYFNRRSHLQGTIALTELKLYQLAERFLGEIKRILDAFDDELKAIERNKLGFELFALLSFAVFLGAGVWRIVSLAVNDILPIGQMFFAYTTYRGFKGTLGSFFRNIGSITEFSNYAGYWFTIEDLKPKIESLPDAVPYERKELPPQIRFENVSFKYEESAETYALKNLSFTIEPGQKVAIVGLSGAGKTTLIKLLCRVYDPISGTIFVDGRDVTAYDLTSWHQQLGVLFQDYTTYEFSAKEAIALGDSSIELDEARVKKAATMAKADGFIERLPKGYDQLLWKGFADGVDISKGERQRMALARVLYRESPITILDEPTASVDALAEQDIFNTLENLPKDRTVILISHRFSTVKNADKILVIEYGQIIDAGTHSELMKRGGTYADLYKLQAESYL